MSGAFSGNQAGAGKKCEKKAESSRDRQIAASRSPESGRLYTITAAARIVGFHPQTLRLYERKGLISPLRTPGNVRRYSDADIERLERIRQLTSSGISLEGVRAILGLETEIARLLQRVRDLQERLRRLEATRAPAVSLDPSSRMRRASTESGLDASAASPRARRGLAQPPGTFPAQSQ
jgi:MerR family transcriptional regulator/heat shock protein HspR